MRWCQQPLDSKLYPKPDILSNKNRSWVALRHPIGHHVVVDTQVSIPTPLNWPFYQNGMLDAADIVPEAQHSMQCPNILDC